MMRSIMGRRGFLSSAGAAAVGALTAAGVPGGWAASGNSRDTYATHVRGIRILPGMWRPHYPWEHIAWISPPWPSQDYLWLDFPEAVFTSQGLLYLSHVNPPFPTVFQDLPALPWNTTEEGISFERVLPNGVAFGGSLTRGEKTTVDLELHLKNGSEAPLRDITLQTCTFLRGIREFADYTRENKYIHVPGSGWINMEQARGLENGTQRYRLGWRNSGAPIADLPIAFVRSNVAERFLGMTWKEHTLSMVSNPGHPCIHADPKIRDLEPGEEASIMGKLIFHEGPLDVFDPSDYGVTAG